MPKIGIAFSTGKKDYGAGMQFIQTGNVSIEVIFRCVSNPLATHDLKVFCPSV